jgi:hypothetical protein
MGDKPAWLLSLSPLRSAISSRIFARLLSLFIPPFRSKPSPSGRIDMAILVTFPDPRVPRDRTTRLTDIHLMNCQDVQR